MKKNILKYTCYGALSTSLLLTTLFSVACSNGPDIPKMTVSYGPEEGFADGNVDLSGETPSINISDIKAEVGTNIDYLSGVIIENEEYFPDLEIWVDASLVDIFTPGDYKAVYTFVYDDKSVSEEITVTLVESEQPASEVTSGDTSTTKNSSSNAQDSETETTSGNKNDNTAGNTVDNQTANNQTDTSQSATPATSQSATTKPNNQSSTTKPDNQSSTAPATSGTKPVQTTTAPVTTKPVQTTTKPTTTRQIITTAGNATTESKNIGNYTIELLSGKSITIKNTTAKYIVSTRTDVSTLEENGKTYRISKLVITYNTGFEQILETVKERIK